MPTGVWLIGALGDVATTTVLGARAVARGFAPPTGLVTAGDLLGGLDLVALGDLVFAGHDVRQAGALEGARGLAAAGVVPGALVDALAGDLEAYAARVRPGFAFGASRVVRELAEAPGEAPGGGPGGAEQAAFAAEATRRAGLAPADALAAIGDDLRAFRAAHGLERVVVVHVASTEPRPTLPPEAETEAGLRGLVARGDERVPASTLYALAALDAGCPYVNFTPSLGASPGGARAAAERLGVPHMGNDGKTGQTLLRTALAPMFRDRNLNVLSWSGFNVLGNRDGAVLDDPLANAAKTTGKDKVLGAILGPRLGTSLTRIDYVPSLGDWKTAWDLVHFEGFLGARMTLETTWRGADSALAAPLVLDLARLLDLAARRGRRGLQPGLAAFFKTPLGTDEQDLAAQMRLLAAWAAEAGPGT